MFHHQNDRRYNQNRTNVNRESKEKSFQLVGSEEYNKDYLSRISIVITAKRASYQIGVNHIKQECGTYRNFQKSELVKESEIGPSRSEIVFGTRMKLFC